MLTSALWYRLTVPMVVLMLSRRLTCDCDASHVWSGSGSQQPCVWDRYGGRREKARRCLRIWLNAENWIVAYAVFLPEDDLASYLEFLRAMCSSAKPAPSLAAKCRKPTVMVYGRRPRFLALVGGVWRSESHRSIRLGLMWWARQRGSAHGQQRTLCPWSRSVTFAVGSYRKSSAQQPRCSHPVLPFQTSWYCLQSLRHLCSTSVWAVIACKQG